MEIRPEKAPIESGTAVLVGALMRRLGSDRVTLTEDELSDVAVTGEWNYRDLTVTLTAPDLTIPEPEVTDEMIAAFHTAWHAAHTDPNAAPGAGRRAGIAAVLRIAREGQ